MYGKTLSQCREELIEYIKREESYLNTLEMTPNFLEKIKEQARGNIRKAKQELKEIEKLIGGKEHGKH
ncbi:hypothetical protein [Caloranaerobacter sp. DY30410]|uniref:hypothetical protein n=1 Tax=Caloranaerobacter sp. DY30410 TaxID=3238305 RepID=UPI003CFF26FD